MSNPLSPDLKVFKISKLEFGHQIEKDACTWFLGRPGTRLLSRNYRCRVGEIDLVFEEERTGEIELVFVEVRARLQSSWESGVESVTFPKQLKLKRTIDHFLAEYSGRASGARVDILAWDGTNWLHVESVWF